MITSLEVCSWPIIKCSAQNIHRIELVHLDSVASRRAALRSAAGAGAQGQSWWSGLGDDGLIGLSWCWGEIAPAVFALLDPMAIEANVALLASDGSPLSPSASAMVLNRIVAALPWQAEAARAARQRTHRRIDAVHLPQPHAMRC